MLELEFTNQFKRDLKKIGKQQKNRALLNTVIEHIQCERPLATKHHDHNLGGDWMGIVNAISAQTGF